MNDEEKWNSGNAPQNDRDTGRFNEPPRYEHYNMHQTYVNETGQESEKKKRRKKSGRIFCFCSWNHSLILRWLIT